MTMKKNPKAQRIKAMLTIRSITMSDIARTTGNSPHTVGTVVNYYPVKKSRRIQEAIANALNKPFEKVWPHERHHRLTISKTKKVVND